MKIKEVIITALCAALISVGAYISIPIGPVPITLQTLFVILTGVIAGRKIGLSAVTIYLALGAIGLPVFSGGVGGFARFSSPTGGFLIGLMPAVIIAGWCADKAYGSKSDGSETTKTGLLWIILGSVVATVMIYVVGLPVLKGVLSLTWTKTFSLGFFPFVAGDLMKIVVVVLLANVFAPKFRAFMHQGEEDSH